jgi:anti-anti-sigma regulatory factor
LRVGHLSLLVVEVVLSGRRDPEFWQEVRDVLEEEIPRRTPQYLVLDLRGLDCVVGSACLGGLVAGAVEMKRLGRLGATRIVVTGEMATRLDRSLALCKLQPLLGPLHDSVTSALLGIARSA